MNSNIVSSILEQILNVITSEVVDKLRGNQELQAAASDEVKCQLETMGFSNFMAWVNTEAFQSKIKALMPELVQLQLTEELEQKVKVSVNKVFDQNIEAKLDSEIEQRMEDFLASSSELKSIIAGVVKDEVDMDELLEQWFRHNSIGTEDIEDFNDEVRRVVMDMKGEKHEDDGLTDEVGKLVKISEALDAKVLRMQEDYEHKFIDMQAQIATLRSDLERVDKEQSEENRATAGMLHSLITYLGKAADEARKYIKI